MVRSSLVRVLKLCNATRELTPLYTVVDILVSYRLRDPVFRCHSAASSAGEGASSPGQCKTLGNGPCPCLKVSSAEGPLFPDCWRTSVLVRSVRTELRFRYEPKHPPHGPHLLPTPPSSGNIFPTTLYVWTPSHLVLDFPLKINKKNSFGIGLPLFGFLCGQLSATVGTHPKCPARPSWDGFQPELKDTQEVAIFVAQGC